MNKTKLVCVLPHWMGVYGYKDQEFIKKGHFSLDMALAFRNLFNEVELVVFSKEGQKEINYQGVKIKFFPLWDRGYFQHKWRHISWPAWRYLCSLDEEVKIYFHQPGVLFGDLILMAKLFGKIRARIFCHIHDLDIFSPIKYYNRWFAPFKKIFYGHVDKFVVGNQIIEKNLQRYSVPPEKIARIRYGISTKKFPDLGKKQSRTELGFRENKFYFLFAGRIHHGKGIEKLIASFEKLRLKFFNIELVIVGPPMRTDLVKKIGKYYKGYQTFTNLCRHYAAADCLVLPSNLEAWGLVLLEAMYYNTPVIATRCGGPEEFITNRDGILIPPRDEEALTAAMKRMVEGKNNWQRKYLHERVKNDFSWNVVVKEYKKVF